MADRHDQNFSPLIGHWTPNVAIDQHGSLVAVFHLSGLAAELADAQTIDAAKRGLNQLARQVADPRMEWWDHFVRQDGLTMTALPPPDNWFGARFDAAYRAMQGTGIYRNDLFFSVLMRPADGLAAGLRALMPGRSAAGVPQASDRFLQDFEAILTNIESGLARFGMRRLGLRGRRSEIFEALHLIANNRTRKIGISAERMGRLIVPERVVFGHMDAQIFSEGDRQFVAMLTLKEYPAGGDWDSETGQQSAGGTSPVMLDALRSAPFGLTIANSFSFRNRTNALDKIGLRIKQMQSGNDGGRSQLRGLALDEDDVATGRSKYGLHHFSVAVHARSLEQLDRNVAAAQTMLAESGITAVRETDAIKPAFYAQLPGNAHWRTRPAAIKSIGAVSFGAKHNVPVGYARGRWGPAVAMLRTTSDTEYGFSFHVQGCPQLPAEDLGNCLLTGPSGSGKTTLLGGIALLSMRNPAARVVIMDKDYGLSVMVNAAGGLHFPLTYGHPTGFSIMQGLDDTPEDHGHQFRTIRACILSDKQDDLTGDEDERLDRAIASQMRMPREDRSLSGVAVMLGQRRVNGRDSAGARLRKWCRGERLGWVLDNERDVVDVSASRILCFETGTMFGDETVAQALMSHIFYRIRKLINGQPIVLPMDEIWRLLMVGAFSDEINDNLKTIRKNEGVVLLATQSAHDAIESDISHTLIQQVPSKFFWYDASAAGERGRKELMEGFGLTRAEYLAVTQEMANKRHVFLLQRPGGSVLCKFDLSAAKDKVAVISARRSTYDLMLRLKAQHGDEPQLWVPAFEKEAPFLVDDPALVNVPAKVAA